MQHLYPGLVLEWYFKEDNDERVIYERVIPYLELTRLYDFHLVAYGRVDHAIITALVERWRQETHTFHLPLGEATITLLELALLKRLLI